LKDKLFVVIGAGGAGKALAYGAKERHARVAVANRNYGTHLQASSLPLKFLPCAWTNAVFRGISERAKALAESVGAEAIELEKLSDFRPETGMILANSTSIGMEPEVTKSPVSKVGFPRFVLSLKICISLDSSGDLGHLKLCAWHIWILIKERTLLSLTIG
jgi:3-dehydroquinate dehydratase/shikimate dehydrogenase